MKLTHEQILTEEKDTLKEKLYDTLESTKLSPGLTKFARISEIIVLLLIGFINGDVFSLVLTIGLAIYAGYRLLKPGKELKSIQKELDEVVERISNYKKFKSSGEKTEKELKKIKKIDKKIGKFTSYLLTVNGKSKIFALIPLVNLFLDEFTLSYTGSYDFKSALHKLLFALREFDSKNTDVEKN